MVFFLAAVYTGFRLVDALVQNKDAPVISEIEKTRRWRTNRRFWQAAAIITVSLILLVAVFWRQWQGFLGDLVRMAYAGDSGSFLSSAFARMAPNAAAIEVDAYVNKALAWLVRIKNGLLILSILTTLPALALTFLSRPIKQLLGWLDNHLGSLPSRASWKFGAVPVKTWLVPAFAAGVILGLLTSIRVLGPLAGLLVVLYFFLRSEERPVPVMLIYASLAGIITFLTWPYLWQAPVSRFLDVLRHMANNPQILPVLFNGVTYPSNKLPATYFPVMLGITLTEPVWFLFLGGVTTAIWKAFRQKVEWRGLFPILLWFLLPFFYVILRRPPMYDGYRHFLFILPPVFVFIALGFQVILDYLRRPVLLALLSVGLIIPGVIGLITTHPYEYTYYNSLVGGTGGAFRSFDTDFWLTCYREQMVTVNQIAPQGSTLYVFRNPAIARTYAKPGLTVQLFDPGNDETFPGSLLLLTTRANADLNFHVEDPEVSSVEHAGAKFCVVKQIQ